MNEKPNQFFFKIEENPRILIKIKNEKKIDFQKKLICFPIFSLSGIQLKEQAIMENRTYTHAQMEAVKKQRAFAWAKVYELHGQGAEQAGAIGGMFARVGGRLQRPAEFPPHITEALWEMANRLNETYTCPICIDLTTKETFHLTPCGHILCKGCYEHLCDHTPVNTKPKCPTCRRNI